MQLLYHELSPVVHGIVRRILEDPEDAREAVQDTFVKAWRRADTYRAERGEVVSWLVLIARSEAINRVRGGARRHRLLEALQREAEVVAPLAEDTPAADAHFQAEAVGQHLAGLSAPQRRALELAFFAGHTQSEISTVLRLPLGTVKNHLRRGLAKLRRRLAPDV